jgi:hypothetical protein
MIESRRVRWRENVARREELKNTCTTLVGNPEQNRPLGRRGHRLEDNIKTDIIEILCQGGECVYQTQS